MNRYGKKKKKKKMGGKCYALCALLCLTGLSAHAQILGTNSFIGQVGLWLTSQNTNDAWGTNDAFTLDAGVDSQNGVGMSASMQVSWNCYKALTLDMVTRNASVAGTAVSEQGDVGITFNLIDVQIVAGTGAGYSMVNKGMFADVFMEARKKMTTRTYVGLRVENDFYLKGGSKNVPLITAKTGFTF